MVGPGAFAILTLLLVSNVSWAGTGRKAPSTVTCRCTCMGEDELGKVHYGQSQGVQFTESSAEKCPNHRCKAGTHDGVTRDCLYTEQSGITHVLPWKYPRKSSADTDHAWRDARTAHRNNHAARHRGRVIGSASGGIGRERQVATFGSRANDERGTHEECERNKIAVLWSLHRCAGDVRRDAQHCRRQAFSHRATADIIR